MGHPPPPPFSLLEQRALQSCRASCCCLTPPLWHCCLSWNFGRRWGCTEAGCSALRSMEELGGEARVAAEPTSSAGPAVMGPHLSTPASPQAESPTLPAPPQRPARALLSRAEQAEAENRDAAPGRCSLEACGEPVAALLPGQEKPSTASLEVQLPHLPTAAAGKEPVCQ